MFGAMNECRLLLSLLTLICVFVSCSTGDDEASDPNTKTREHIAELEEKLRSIDINEHPEQRYFRNHPLPTGKGSARVLCIGNSYTVDALRHITSIMESAGIHDK